MKGLASLVVALALSFATVWIQPSSDETAMYGSEGRLDETWLPREVAGWPAPFLADTPGISVTHKIGVEDTFRLGPFIGTLSFWFIVTLAVGALIRQRHRH